MQSDLALYHDEVSTTRAGNQVEAVVTIRNMGAAASNERRLSMSYDQTPLDTRDDPNPVVLDNNYPVPSIPPGGKLSIRTHLALPGEFAGLKVPLYFRLSDDKADTIKSNDGTWVVVDAAGRSR